MHTKEKIHAEQLIQFNLSIIPRRESQAVIPGSQWQNASRVEVGIGMYSIKVRCRYDSDDNVGISGISWKRGSREKKEERMTLASFF